MPRTSAGILMFRRTNGDAEVLLVHPGGPFWAKKDAGAWSIPKGEPEPGEDHFACAKREFAEEMGSPVEGDFIPLEPCRQAGGKVVSAWAVRSDFDPAGLESNTFSMEWPPRSGRQQAFPEVDRAAWFSLDEARGKILSGQVGLLDQLAKLL
ncbi:MAG: NUDIX domain-containing protein [Acidobacteriota bacterium]|nr:NUDIX domain-containing protein [Acidobacteriota bacterium]